MVCLCVCAWMCAVILQIMLFLHPRFRKRQCWSLVSFLSICLPLSTQELLLHRTSCGTLHYSLLEKETNFSVFCSSSLAWKGKRLEKRTVGAFPRGRKRQVPCLSSHFTTQMRSLSPLLSFSPDLGNYMMNACRIKVFGFI